MSPVVAEILQQIDPQVRQQGKPTADDKALDGDVILADQAILISSEEYPVIVELHS